ncbi:MAG: hypothetical protein SVZ03_01335 [Spirochaetota bacterium]|nr:hypothetical protein [Spirochaetota bacterium]
MKKMFRILFAVLTFGYFSQVLAEAATLTGTPPTVTVTRIGSITDSAILNPINSEIETELINAFNLAVIEANESLSIFQNQDDLAKGFANANAYASRAATHQGYQDYSHFAVTTGIMVGVQTPSIDPDYYDDLEDKVKEDGDLYAGVGVGLAMINVGINANFIYPGLYLSFKFGKLPESINEIDDFQTKSTLLGLGLNYTWKKSKDYFMGLIRWRGISLGTGLLYNKTEVDLTVNMEPIIEEIPDYDLSAYGLNDITGVSVELTPSFVMGVHAKTISIPFDATTSVRLLWVLNLNLGAGVDIDMGTSDIILEAAGDVHANVPENADVEMSNIPGSVIIDGSTRDAKPSFVRPRVTTGVGINILPIKIDIPITWYLTSGFAVGITAGIVW